MSSQCSDCYGGCVQIVSDRCVMYTGIDIPLLDIKKGDSLSFVEQAIITFLQSVLDGSGIKITIDEDLYCELITQYLDDCEEVTALGLFKAIVQAACNLQEQIDKIEADYTVGCLEEVSAGDGTHDILQAVINKLCEIETDLGTLTETVEELSANLESNYVLIADINTYIAAYIESTAISNRYYTRMVPYTVVEYYGSLANFDITGAGIVNTEWEQIYLCNGQNGTPDKRGRSPIGAIDGVPGGALSSVVNPASDPIFNYNYAVGDINGANKITLTEDQLAAHQHDITDLEHTHDLAVDESSASTPLVADTYIARQGTAGTESEYSLANAAGGPPDVGKVGESFSGITITESAGGGEAHSNVPPVLACYYIMYIPS